MVKGEVEFDDSAWPLLRIIWSSSVSDARFDQYLARYTRYLDRGERFAVIQDARVVLPTPASQRRRMAAWMRAHDHTLRTQCLGVAFVITSVITRMALRSVLYLTPLPTESIVCAHPGEAARWCHARLVAAGVLRDAVRGQSVHGAPDAPPPRR